MQHYLLLSTHASHDMPITKDDDTVDELQSPIFSPKRRSLPSLSSLEEASINSEHTSSTRSSEARDCGSEEEDLFLRPTIRSNSAPSSGTTAAFTTMVENDAHQVLESSIHLQPDQVLKQRQNMVIRQQYLNQLGINLSSTALERNTRHRRMKNRIGYTVKLKEAVPSRRKNFLKAFSKWYNSLESNDGKDEEMIRKTSSHESHGDSSCDESEERKSKLRFKEEVDIFLIPVHSEYSNRQRDSMWHRRNEFVEMVERNLEEMYDEMDREYELELEQKANELMVFEEQQQRRSEEASSALSSSPPIAAAEQIPRARTPHEIRAKYLKQLGI